jgi:predicted DNA-binding transcriptional regulator YafY
VRMTYQSSSNPQGVQRDMDPYALVHRWGWWYVVGFCHLRQDLRSFRVDRISELNLSGQTFSVPDKFDLHAYLLQESRYIPQMKVRIRFLPQFAHLATMGRGYWEQLEAQPDGSVIVTFYAPDVYAAASTSIAYGPTVIILDPPEVRRMVKEWAQAAVNLYSLSKG